MPAAAPLAAPLSATVVAFPPMQPSARLDAALCRLQQALRVQGEAVAAWRRSLSELGAAASTLDRSVKAYDARLTCLASGVANLHGASRELEAIASSAIRG